MPVELRGQLIFDYVNGDGKLYLRNLSISKSRNEHLKEVSGRPESTDIEIKLSSQSRRLIRNLEEDAWVGTTISIRGVYADEIFARPELKNASIATSEFRSGNVLAMFKADYEQFQNEREVKRACDQQVTGQVLGFNSFQKPMTPWEGGKTASQSWTFRSHVPVTNGAGRVG